MSNLHIPVLLDEVVKSFINLKNGVILDATLGYGGHSSAILKSNPNIKIIACDRDDMAIEYCKNLFKNEKRIEIYKSNFSNLLNLINPNEVCGILADIGVSSLQLDLDERGFGLNSTKLDMRMDKNQKFSAKDVVNLYSFEQLSEIFFKFGELTNSKQIAQKIISAREKNPINSAKELSQIIGSNNIKNRQTKQAVLVFQAIRIEVNKELDELSNLLKNIKNSKINNAICDIITFHSLEDRIVKNTFKEWEKSCICPEFAIKCECGNNHAIGKILNKKPITASNLEIKANSRSSCAKMRIFEIKR